MRWGEAPQRERTALAPVPRWKRAKSVQGTVGRLRWPQNERGGDKRGGGQRAEGSETHRMPQWGLRFLLWGKRVLLESVERGMDVT